MHPDEGQIAELDNILNRHEDSFTVILFTDDLTIDADTVLTDLHAPTFTGYGEIAGTGIVWPGAAIDGDGAALVNSPTITFTCTADPGSPELIYGIAVKIGDPTATYRLWFAQNFDTPVVIAANGDKVEKKLNFKKRNY